MNFATWPRVLVVDVEGNGATPPDLVEIAVMPLTDGAPDVPRARCWLIRPPAPIQARVTRVHGITNNAVRDAPTWPQVADEAAAILDGAWIAAHSATIEYQVLTRHLPDWRPAGVLDTLRLARATHPDAPSHGLDALIEHTHITTDTIPGRRHRAAYDAHATALLLLNLAAHHPTWDAMAAVAVPPGLPGHPETTEATLW